MEELIKLRNTRKITQADVSDAIGVSRRAYASYETSEREPSLNTLNKMADYFEVSVDVLMGRGAERDIFDDSRIPKTREQQLYDMLPPHLQESIVSRMEGYLDVLNEQKKTERREHSVEILKIQTLED